MRIRDQSTVAVLTPSGRGAIAVVSVRGPRAIEVVNSVFRPARGGALGVAASDRIRLGRLGRGEGDEVVATIVGHEPPEVEVHCHGGPAVVRLAVSALVNAGAVSITPRSRAKHTGTRRDAERTLPLAETLRVAEVLLDQAEGAFNAALAQIAGLLSIGPCVALRKLDILIKRHEFGEKMITGWDVVIAGPPNAGKSSLFNALAGHERAIVSEVPGTTRDVLRFRTACSGWPVTFLDTAGTRQGEGPIEVSGIARAKAARERADLVLWVLDRSQAWDPAALPQVADETNRLVLASKCDLPAAWTEGQVSAMPISAVTGEGLERLLATIGHHLVPHPPQAGEAVPWSAGHARRLHRLRRLVMDGEHDEGLHFLHKWMGRS